MKRASKGRKPVRDRKRKTKEWKPTRLQRGETPSRYSPSYHYYAKVNGQ